MAMEMGQGRGGVVEINVTPLIDVLLVLLIIFMVIVPVRPRGLESSVPQPGKAADASGPGPVMLELRAGSAGAPGAGFRVDGQPVERGGLEARLRATLSARPQPSLLVAADRSLSYDEVAQAIAIARNAGAAPIGVTTPAMLAAGR